MKKFFSIFLIIFLLSTSTYSCNIVDEVLGNIDENLSNQEEYTIESYSLKNNLNETYTIKYKEVIGFPDNRVDVKIYDSEEQIAWYAPCDYKNFDKIKPQRIMFLYGNDKNKLYYVGTDSRDYIFIYGSNNLKLNDDNINISKELVNDEENIDRNRYIKLSEMLNNVELSKLKERFEKCGYNYDNIVNLYNMSK